MEIIYNCGYHRQFRIPGKATSKRYIFRRTFVTTVDDKDGTEFLKMTSDDIGWCEQNDKSMPPFMTLEDWCANKPGAFRAQQQIYDPKEYTIAMHL